MIKHLLGLLGVFLLIGCSGYSTYLSCTYPDTTYRNLWIEHPDEMGYMTVANIVGLFLFVFYFCFGKGSNENPKS